MDLHTNIGFDGLSGGSTRRHAWQKGEVFKGRGMVHGTTWAGWWFEPPGYPSSFINSFQPDIFCNSPIFQHDPIEMVLSAPPNNITTDEFLAKGIPALSQSIGGRSIAIPDPLNLRNIDMNSSSFRPSPWPNSLGDNTVANRWLHSDFKNVAYFYTYKLFDDFVERGELK